ncbi:MAG: hypothetical protein ACK5O1_06065 [Holosporales bacterium]
MLYKEASIKNGAFAVKITFLDASPKRSLRSPHPMADDIPQRIKAVL